MVGGYHLKKLRRRILHTIYELEFNHCATCPLENLSTNSTGEPEKLKQRNHKHCMGCPIYDAIREQGEQLNILSKKSTFNKVRKRNMDNPMKYLQYKEYSLQEVIQETGLTKYKLRKYKKQLE